MDSHLPCLALAQDAIVDVDAIQMVVLDLAANVDAVLLEAELVATVGVRVKQRLHPSHKPHFACCERG